MQTDASEKGIGTVLAQLGSNSSEHPVAYANRRLLPRETNYPTIEKECLAVVWAVQYFQRYLYVRDFKVQTDHRRLEWLHRAKGSNTRLTRWSLSLQPYQMEVVYTVRITRKLNA